MSGISKTIELIKKADPRYDGKFFTLEDKEEFADIVIQAIMPIIDELKNVQAERDDFKFLRSEASKASKKYKAELETVSQANKLLTDRLRDAGEVANKAETALGTANKRIAELEVEND